MRRRDNGYLCRQPLAKLLQSVAISVGVGKSHIAQALEHLAIRHGADARFLKTSRHWLTWPAATPTTPGTSGSELARPAVLILHLSGVLSHPSVTSANVA